MSPSNVLKFPTGQPNDISLKLFAVIFYVFLAVMMTLGSGMSEGGFTLLIVLGLLYNFTVRQRFHHTAYFKKNKVLLIILLVIFLLAFQLMVIYFLALAGVYWFLVGRSGREAPYFLRFHMLTGLILNFFILLPYLLLASFLALIKTILLVAHVSFLITPVGQIQSGLEQLTLVVFWGVALWFSVSALLGRTPYVALVTSNVRHWS